MKVIINAKLQELYNKALAQMGINNINSYVLKKVLNKEVINKAFIDLIIIQNLLFQAVEWKKKNFFFKALNPHLKSIISLSHAIVARIINNLFQLKMDIIQKKLQSALIRIYLFVDI